MYDLEIVIGTDRLNRKLETLRQDFPQLEIVRRTMTHWYAILACERVAPLAEDEKEILRGYVEQKLIYVYRCGKQD